MFVGITGLIGSGKSTAAALFAEHGAAIIDADRIGQTVVDENPELLEKLIAEFGPEIVDDSGKLLRKELAALAFSSDEAKEKLNRLIHPYLLRELRLQMRELSRQYKIVVIDAALLLDWSLDGIVDLVLVIDAPEKLRFRRLEARGISAEDARARQDRQLDHRVFTSRADYLIVNDKSPEEFHAELTELIEKLLSDRIDF